MTWPDKLGVLLTSPSYPQTNSDWRGVFIGRLVGALSDRLNVRLWAPPGPTPDSVTYVCTSAEQSFLVQLMQDGGISQLLRSSKARGIWSGVQLWRHLAAVYAREQSADVVHANWLQTCLGISRSRLPLVVTALGNDMALLRIPGMIRMLRAQFSHRPVVIAPNADWMAESLDKAFGRQARIAVVPFGMDDSWYQVDRKPSVGPR
ncbi:MAG: group 1 glycosyl transferase, partial [Gammaproteobacteria bacterium]